MRPLCFSDWFIVNRALKHFDSDAREILVTLMMRSLRQRTSSGTGAEDTTVYATDNSSKLGKYFEMSM
jgi:hypothetical protein